MAFEHYDGTFQEYLLHTARAVADERFQAGIAKDSHVASLHSQRARMIKDGLEGSLKSAYAEVEHLVESNVGIALHCPDVMEFLMAVVDTSKKFEGLAYNTSDITRKLMDNHRREQLKGKNNYTERRTLGLPQVEFADYSKR